MSVTLTNHESIESVSNIPLPIIDYNLLVQKNPRELNRLFEACTTLGFFYLKLENQLDPDDLFILAENVFKLPLDTKMNYSMDGKNGVYFGYKAVGTMFSDRIGTPDRMEFWNISKDEILIEDKKEFPEPIIHSKTIVKEYMMKSHEIVLVILEALSLKLGLESRAFPDCHRLMQPSGDQLRLTKSTMYPTQNDHMQDVAFGAHTDFGSITILFNRLGGLQVLLPNSKWLDIPVLPGHAIINLGDAMVKLSGGILKSNIHRIVTMAGFKQIVDRYSIVYFSRPENNILMKSLINNGTEEQSEDRVLTAKEWIAVRVKNYQIANYKDESTYENSRGTESQRGADADT